MRILITGSAGFIGYHLCKKLLTLKNAQIFGIDNINDYYDIKLKKDRIKNLKKNSKNFNFYKLNICNKKILKKNFLKNKYNYVIHLAAQAGVRYSIDNPSKYFDSNLVGFFNILEMSKEFKIKHLIFASTSSVYGSNIKFPLKETENTDKPLSFYAATKKSNEVMAYSYSNIYKLACTGLRFFTVYGPFGRPDMALSKFTKSIIKSKKINLYNKGNHIRDFTYIDDVVFSIEKIIKKPSKKNIPFEIFNIGCGNPKHLKTFLSSIERNIGKKAKINLKNIQPGDIYKTHASITKLNKITGNKRKINIEKGIKEFVLWFKNYYRYKD